MKVCVVGRNTSKVKAQPYNIVIAFCINLLTFRRHILLLLVWLCFVINNISEKQDTIQIKEHATILSTTISLTSPFPLSVAKINFAPRLRLCLGSALSRDLEICLILSNAHSRDLRNCREDVKLAAKQSAEIKFTSVCGVILF